MLAIQLGAGFGAVVERMTVEGPANCVLKPVDLDIHSSAVGWDLVANTSSGSPPRVNGSGRHVVDRWFDESEVQSAISQTSGEEAGGNDWPNLGNCPPLTTSDP